MVWPIQNGTVELVDVQKKTIVGYGFSDPGAPDRQRWVLYAGYCAPPVGTVRLQRPQSTARQYKLLDQWQNAVRQGGLWEGDATYVKVNIDAYSSIGNYNPPPFDSGADKQIDEGACVLHQAGVLAGHVFGVKRAPGRIHEYWVLRASYGSPLDRETVAGPPGAGEQFQALSDFLQRMQSTWQVGSTYAIAACSYFTELPPQL
ncbi:hypothetical protein WMF30_51605 [Sorangium sp. So ce134]